MKMRCRRRRVWRDEAAFSLVEIALSLGIIGFALIGIVGALPLAMNNGRMSIAQSRAASLATTMFANFRTQPFSTVQYLDGPAASPAPSPAPNTINLNLKTTAASDNVPFYAYFDEAASVAPAGDMRRLHFVSVAPPGTAAYRIVLRFNNSPAGMLAPYYSAPNVLHAQGNGIEASIFETDRPNDVFRFDAVIANRWE